MKLHWKKSQLIWSYFFILPAFFFFIVFRLYPLLHVFVLSFQKWDIQGAKWIGFKNYEHLLNSQLFGMAFWHTLLYTVLVVSFWMASAFGIAFLLQSFHQKIKNLFRGLYYLPHVTGVVVLSLTWAWIYEPQIGLFNHVIKWAGGQPVMWLQDPNLALWSIILSSILVIPGSGVILYSAAFAALPTAFEEAAELDGANRWQKIFFVFLPLLKPTTLYLLVIYTIAGFQVFDRVYLMTGGGPVNATTTLMQLIYLTAFRDANYGLASAQSAILFFAVCSVTFLTFRLLRVDFTYQV
ncbi:MAG: ABC transporter permease [Anaerolineaceae bacterium]|nr:ABC transporter permease [Anaerolineaceae bacterium]